MFAEPVTLAWLVDGCRGAVEINCHVDFTALIRLPPTSRLISFIKRRLNYGIGLVFQVNW